MRFAFLFFLLLAVSCSSAKKNIHYFDTQDQPISKKDFKRLQRNSRDFLVIQGDSVNHKRLVNRLQSGTLASYTSFLSKLEKASDKPIDTVSPIVIFYHPGKDECNSGGLLASDRNVLQNYYRNIESELLKISNINLLYICKDFSGLELHEGLIPWKKDPDQLIEHTFFEYHYPCKSFVVIGNDGRFISYRGEFSPESLYQAVSLLK